MTKYITINLNNKTRNKIILKDFYKQASLILQDTPHSGIVEIDLTICGKLFMRKINLRYRSIDRATDVLSFPLIQLQRGKPTKNCFTNNSETPIHLGDIFICHDIAATQAKTENINTDEEIIFLFNHGLKHLLGFHHK